MRIWGHEYIPSNSSINYLGWEQLGKAAENEPLEGMEEDQDSSLVLRVLQGTEGC